MLRSGRGRDLPAAAGRRAAYDGFAPCRGPLPARSDSLVYFYETDHDAVIESLKPPIGKPNDHQPVVSAEFLKERLDAITIG